jgi:hypothetical protein
MWLRQKLNAIEARLLNIQRGQAEILRLLKKETMSSQAILDEVTALQGVLVTDTSAENSAIALINGFAAQLNAAVAAATDDTAAVAAMKSVIATFQANDAALASAVVAATPAAPPTPAPVAPIVAPPASATP